MYRTSKKEISTSYFLMIRGPMKVMDDSKLILNDQDLDLFRITVESFRTFRCLLFLKQITGRELLYKREYIRTSGSRIFHYF